jgi:2-C-methyl-D-erythritol 4-phosphate cytidylyltransferase
LLAEYGNDHTVVVEGGSSRHKSIRNGVEALGSSVNGGYF